MAAVLDTLGESGKRNDLIPLWDSHKCFFLVHLIVIHVFNMICDCFRAYGQIVYQTTDVFSKSSYCFKILYY